jgi:hypothetical protein
VELHAGPQLLPVEQFRPRGALQQFGERLCLFHHAASAASSAGDSATAPNTPPCMVTILSAARWLP